MCFDVIDTMYFGRVFNPLGPSDAYMPTEQRTRSVSSGLSKQLGHMPRIRSKQSIHQMGRFAHLSVTLLTQYFSLPLLPVRSDPSKEAVTNDQSRKGNLFDFFLLAVDRSWLSIRQASWTRFTIDHSKIQNECKFFIGDGIFSLLVCNPSAVSAITMPANGESLLGRSSVICPSKLFHHWIR